MTRRSIRYRWKHHWFSVLIRVFSAGLWWIHTNKNKLKKILCIINLSKLLKIRWASNLWNTLCVYPEDIGFCFLYSQLIHINQFPKLEVPFASNLSPGQQGGRYLPCLAWNPVPMVPFSSLSLLSWEWLNLFPRDERQFALKLSVHGPSSSSSLGLVCLFHCFKNLSLHQGSLFSIWDQSCTSSQLVLHHCTLLVALLPCRGGFAFYVLKAIPHITAKLIAFLLYCWFVCFPCFPRVGIYPHRRCEKWTQLSTWPLRLLPQWFSRCRRHGWIPESERYPGRADGNLLQYFFLENPVDRGVWEATVHRVTRGSDDWATEHTAPTRSLVLFTKSTFPLTWELASSLRPPRSHAAVSVSGFPILPH